VSLRKLVNQRVTSLRRDTI